MNPHSEAGISTFDGSGISPRVHEYFQSVGITLADNVTPPYWGGAFLAWLAQRHGMTPPANAADPEAWREWGKAMAHPQAGCIAILTGGNGSASRSIIGLVQRADGQKIYMTGGDLGGRVGTEVFSLDRVIECRRPPDLSEAAEPLPVSVMAPAVAPSSAPANLPDLWRVLQQMQTHINRLERMIATHEHTPVKADGTPIPWDDFVLKSEILATAETL